MSEGTFERDGVALRYIEEGRGPDVLFQHGLGGDGGQIAEIYPDHPETHRITLECRAHGTSAAGALTQLSIATFTDDVAALAADRGVSRAVVGGISMGAAIALRMAVTRPALVRSPPARRSRTPMAHRSNARGIAVPCVLSGDVDRRVFHHVTASHSARTVRRVITPPYLCVGSHPT